MEGGYPVRPGDWAETVALRPIAWLVCAAFAADEGRQPWDLALRDTREGTIERFAHGYLCVAAGTRPLDGRQRAAARC